MTWTEIPNVFCEIPGLCSNADSSSLWFVIWYWQEFLISDRSDTDKNSWFVFDTDRSSWFVIWYWQEFLICVWYWQEFLICDLILTGIPDLCLILTGVPDLWSIWYWQEFLIDLCCDTDRNSWFVIWCWQELLIDLCCDTERNSWCVGMLTGIPDLYCDTDLSHTSGWWLALLSRRHSRRRIRPRRLSLCLNLLLFPTITWKTCLQRSYDMFQGLSARPN